jgi:hypothetical protein
MFLFEHSPFEASRMKIVFPSLHPLIDIYTPNAVLSGKLQLAKISEARTKSQL